MLAKTPRLNVLILDDNKRTARRLSDAAQEILRGYQEDCLAQSAHTFSDAIPLVEALGNEDRVYVLVDIELDTGWAIEGVPVDGWGVLNWLKAKLPRAKIVLYSAHNQPEDVGRALEEGAYDLVSADSVDNAEKGIIAILAGFATIERRLRAAQDAAQSELDPAVDPLAHLLLKVNIGLLIVGRRGHVWFQNDNNRQINRCSNAQGFLCHREFHGWKCLSGRCPWCPTLEAIASRESKKRVLVLPVRRPGETQAYALECVDMASEPIWSLLETGAAPSAAGAIESVLLRTPEWHHKDPIQRILDLSVMIAGILSERFKGLRLTVYEVAESQISCRPIASCVVARLQDVRARPSLKQHVSLEVWKSSPDWHGEIVSPGPATDLRFVEKADTGPIESPFRIETQAAELHDKAIPTENPLVPVDEIGASGYAGSVTWLRLRMGEPRPVAIVEVGFAEMLHSDVDTSGSENEQAVLNEFVESDLALYLAALQETIAEERQRRGMLLAERCPRRPQIGKCKDREVLWTEVQKAIASLAMRLALGPEGVWWHFREFRSEDDIAGKRQYFLLIAADALHASPSPYAQAASQVRPTVSLPPPGTWEVEQKKFQPDPRTKKGVYDPNNSLLSGSYLCRVSGGVRLTHITPSAEENSNYHAVMEHARTHSMDSYRLLTSIRSYGDFPVGNSSDPLGTFHVQSTHEDLFAADAVCDYLAGLADEILLALVKMRDTQKEQEIRSLQSKAAWRRFVAEATAGRQAEVESIVREIIALPDRVSIDANALTSLSYRLQGKLVALQHLSSMESFRSPAADRSLHVTDECDLRVVAKDALQMTKRDVSHSQEFTRIIDVAIGESSDAIPLSADYLWLRTALAELFGWILKTVPTSTSAEIDLRLSRDASTHNPIIEIAFAQSGFTNISGAYTDICNAEPTAEKLLDTIDKIKTEPSRDAAIHFALVRLLIARALPTSTSQWTFTPKDVQVRLMISIAPKEEE